MSARERVFLAHVESERRHAERGHLVENLAVAQTVFRARPWDHGAEVAYQAALEDLIRFEESKSPRVGDEADHGGCDADLRIEHTEAP